MSNFDFRAVLKAFGANDEELEKLEKGEIKMEEFVSSTVGAIGEAQKTRFASDWEKEHRKKIESDAQIGNYNSVKGKLWDTFKDLIPKPANEKDVKFEDVLAELRGKLDAQKSEFDGKLKTLTSEQQNVHSLTEQLKAFQEYEQKYKELEGKIPTLMQEHEQKVKNGFLLDSIKKDTFSQIKDINPAIDFDVFDSYLQTKGYKIELTDAEKKEIAIRDKDGNLVPSLNPKVPVSTLPEFYTKLATEKNWIIKANEVKKEEGGNPAQKPTTVEVKTW